MPLILRVGIDPEANEDQQKYIDDLCENFHKTMTDMITAGMEERSKHAICDDLYEEVLQHSLFAQAKCRSFQGREEMLEVWWTDYWFTRPKSTSNSHDLFFTDFVLRMVLI